MNPFLRIINQTLQKVNILEYNVLFLEFEDYSLTIYNKFSPANYESLEKLENIKVIGIDIENEVFFKLVFQGELSLTVFIDDNSYTTPEAMQLKGKDNLIAIW